MISAPRPQIKKHLYKLEEYMHCASTRVVAYEKLAEELGVTVQAIRNAASKAGLTSGPISLRRTFSPEEEEMLVCASLVYARQGTPFTIPVFAEVARYLAGRDESEPFSRHFVSDFVERHKDVLTVSDGKMTSPTRSFDTMCEMTEDFITMFNSLLSTNKMNEKNIFVFDETIIGGCYSLPKVVGETKGSAGGNNNVIMLQESALGSYIPFSMVDGTTPFRVFVFRTKELEQSVDPELTLVPGEEKGLRGTPHRLFLSSESGYISTDLFRCIMEEFTIWWTSTHAGLDCYLISDNLAIHRNKDIVATAESNGIHLLNIMPGSSHWFQVHDQLPFAILKKKIMVEKNRCFASFFLPREVVRTTLMSDFYEAEKCALEPSVVIKSFRDVGLWPFMPEVIRGNCRKFCSVETSVNLKDPVNRVANAVKACMSSELNDARQKLHGMKVVRLMSLRSSPTKKTPRKKVSKKTPGQVRGISASTKTNNMNTTYEPPQKRGRPPGSKNKKEVE